MDILDEPQDGFRWKGTYVRSFCESFIKIWHQELCQDSTHPPSLFQESRRKWIFLTNLEMVSDGREHISEVSVKVSLRSDIRNHVKTPPVLQVSSWSLGGHWHPWWTWSWCQMRANIHQKLLWKFHQNLTCFGCFREDLALVLFGMVWFSLACYG